MFPNPTVAAKYIYYINKVHLVSVKMVKCEMILYKPAVLSVGNRMEAIKTPHALCGHTVYIF